MSRKISTIINIANNHTSNIDKISCSFIQIDDTTNTGTVHNLQLNIDEPQIGNAANKSATNDYRILQNYKVITPFSVYGVGKDNVACHLTGYGIIIQIMLLP